MKQPWFRWKKSRDAVLNRLCSSREQRRNIKLHQLEQLLWICNRFRQTDQTKTGDLWGRDLSGTFDGSWEEGASWIMVSWKLSPFLCPTNILLLQMLRQFESKQLCSHFRQKRPKSNFFTHMWLKSDVFLTVWASTQTRTPSSGP